MSNSADGNKAEYRLYDEIVKNCLDGDDSPLRTQYKVNFKHSDHGVRQAKLDIAIPELHIAIRVMGGVHGEPFAMNVHDEIQLELLEWQGWDVIDVWTIDRPDLWI